MESRDKEIIASCDSQNTELNDCISPETGDMQSPSKPKKPLLKRIYESPLFTRPMKIICLIFLASLLIYILSRFITNFAEFWTRYPAHGIRFVLAKLTGWIPFSLAEALLISIPFLTIGYLVISGVSTKKDESDENYFRWIRPLIALILIITTIFMAGFGPAYGRFKLARNLGLEQKAVSAQELYDTGVIIGDEMAPFIGNIKFDANGSSIMPYDYHTLVGKMNDAFGKFAKSVDFVSHFKSNPKPIALSEPMTYTHISGVYTFMTGESNINTHYPDFLQPFTMAHEMAHQRGIAREDEANFIAYLVCIGSDDEYIRYSGYANMANYIASALSSADKELYSQLLINKLPTQILKEYIAYSDFFTKYRNSTASDVTGTVNNLFLQSQGQTAGTKSYGLVVDLAVAYYK